MIRPRFLHLNGVDYRVGQYLEFPTSEYERRLRAIQSEMAAQGLDAVAVTSPQNIRYFTGFRTLLFKTRLRPFVAILPADTRAQPILLVPEVLEGCAIATSWTEDIRSNQECYGKPATSMLGVIAEAVRTLGDRPLTIGAEFGDGVYMAMTRSDFAALQDATPNVTWSDAMPMIWKIRSVKSDLEIEALQVACDIGAAGIEAAAAHIRPGISEIELERHVVAAYYREGAEEHLLIFASGAKGYQVRDAPASDAVFEKGHVTKVDGGVMYKGYWSEFCRMIAVGSIDPRHEAAMRVSIAANAAAIAKARPGVPIMDLADAAIGTARSLGYRTYMNSIGHNVGMEPHEPPWLTTSNDQPLEAGMVLSIESGILTDEFDEGSFTFEENLVVTDAGPRILTHRVPAEPIIAA